MNEKQNVGTFFNCHHLDLSILCIVHSPSSCAGCVVRLAAGSGLVSVSPVSPGSTDTSQSEARVQVTWPVWPIRGQYVYSAAGQGRRRRWYLGEGIICQQSLLYYQTTRSINWVYCQKYSLFIFNHLWPRVCTASGDWENLVTGWKGGDPVSVSSGGFSGFRFP